MTRHVGSLEEMAFIFASTVASTSIALGTGLEQVMAAIERTARGKIGRYQQASGPFPEWPLLSDAYEHEKVKAGYGADQPLLREGDMVRSFSHQVDRVALEGVAGATDHKMVFHELGTEHMPARPVWGPALFENRDLVQKLVGAAVMSGLIGGGAQGALGALGLAMPSNSHVDIAGDGYNFTTRD